MVDQVFKDKFGNKIGSLSTDTNGIQTVKDKFGNKKGTYDPKTNKTKDKNGNRIGEGNLLATLI